MIRKLILPILAVLGVCIAIYTVRAQQKEPPVADPVAPPPSSEYKNRIAGAGIVEASTENVQVSAVVPGVVTKLYVKVGDKLKAGDPLFTVDDRDAAAQVEVANAALDAAKERYDKLLQSPRKEDIPPLEAKVKVAEAEAADKRDQLALWKDIEGTGAVSQDELNRRRYAVNVADANLSEAAASLAQLKAGAWKPDLAIAQAEIASAKANLDAAQIDLNRRTVHSRIDGTVLQVKTRLGEYAPSSDSGTPLMLIGDTAVLHVRVDVDENDAWRLKPDAPAVASLRGNSALKTKLSFVRIEPYVVPKRSLTGESTERVDTRVLQVIYSFPNDGKLPVFVGQQMDVFIQAPAQ